MEDRNLRELQEEIELLKAELRRGPTALLRGLLGLVPSSRRARVALVAAVLVVATASYAGQISLPHIFENGQIADAVEVNANFSTLVAESNTQDDRLTVVEGDLATHEGDPSAHHVKTTSFSDLGDLATDAQIPDDITILYANTAGSATTAGDADTLDTLDSTDFSLSGHDHDDRYYPKAYVDALEVRIAALEALLVDVSRGGTPDTLTFSGMNVQIVDGSGGTGGVTNGLGNLIVGYNENNYSATRTGSHNFVVGMDHEYTSYAGLVAGDENTISGTSSSVSGGWRNTASGYTSSVSGGYYNTASGSDSSVSGGAGNEASGSSCSVSGGYYNDAAGDYSNISGGYHNVTQGGDYSSVSGGYGNTASGTCSSVSGGYGNKPSGNYSSVGGGEYNSAGGEYSSVSGGYYNTAAGADSSVSGGHYNGAGGGYSSVSGGHYNIARADYSSVSGGRDNDAAGDYSSISGGYFNVATSGQCSSISGGHENYASGDYSSISGGYNNTASGTEDSVVGDTGDVYVDATVVH